MQEDKYYFNKGTNVNTRYSWRAYKAKLRNSPLPCSRWSSLSFHILKLWFHVTFSSLWCTHTYTLTPVHVHTHNTCQINGRKIKQHWPSPLCFWSNAATEAAGDNYIDVYSTYKCFDEKHAGLTFYVVFWRKKDAGKKSSPAGERHI